MREILADGRERYAIIWLSGWLWDKRRVCHSTCRSAHLRVFISIDIFSRHG